MTSSYSTESVQERLDALGLPFSDIFARALVALLTTRKISLHSVTQLMPGEQNPEANRQQIRRCLEHDSLTADSWTQAIASLLPKGKWILALDRTEWKRGDTTINLLVLAVVVHGSAVPLLWTVMPDCGASVSTQLRESDTAERIALLGRFVALFTRKRLHFLTADREFIGAEWIAWLLSENLPFRIRIKANTMLTHEDRAEQSASKWFEKRACRCKTRPMEVWGLPVFVGGKRLKTKDRNGNIEYLIIISNEKSASTACCVSDDLWQDYRLRWKIETLFQALKGRGFALESCRLSKENRLSGWFGFLALGFCACKPACAGV